MSLKDKAREIIYRNNKEDAINQIFNLILQSLSDIKPLGKDEIKELEEVIVTMSRTIRRSNKAPNFLETLAFEVRWALGTLAKLQAALEDYNRQMKEKFNG